MKTISFNNREIIANKNSKFNISRLKTYSANGKYTKKSENWLKSNIKCKEAILVHSCTAALEMTAILLNIKKNDEIIMPSYTFVSTANAFVMRGGVPKFVDIDPKTMNIDPLKIEAAITKKTKAIVVVHYAGVGCDLENIIMLCKKYKIYLIEDAAQAILSNYKNKPLGSFGDLSTISFHESKNIHCGEGGALLINNKKFIKRAKIIRDKGTNRDQFDRNITKKYTWVDYGSSYGLSEINAFVLYSQLIKSKKIIRRRIKVYNLYRKLLLELEKKKRILLPYYNKKTRHNAHIFYIHVKNRSKLIEYLKKNNIMSVFHYVPLHSSPFGKKNCKTYGSMKYTNLKSNSILRLPIHNKLKKQNVKYICKKLKEYFKN